MKKLVRRFPLSSIAIIVLSLLAPLYMAILSFSQFQELVYHGPNPSTDSIFSSSEVEGIGNDESEDFVVNLKENVDNVMMETQEIKPKSVPDFGIAAGGWLVNYDQDELNHYFELLSALGVRWVRWDIGWNLVQPENAERYDWEGTDRVAETAKRYNIKSLGIITYSPRWASEKSCNRKSQCAPADPVQFGTFAGKVAERYRGSIEYWEIWNEPNFVNFWSPKPNAKKYAEVLKEAYIAIKSANPEALVLSGGLASTGNEKDGSISPTSFMRVLYEEKANQYFDAVALHPYTYPASPQYRAWWNRWQEILPIGKLMIENGDRGKKIWITEFGAPTGGPGSAFGSNQLNSFAYGTDYMSEKAQKDLLLEASEFYKKHVDWMGPFFWYSLKDNNVKRDTPENFFGLLRHNESKKPAYNLFQELISQSGEYTE